ncbi:hypothetical protein PS2_026265 [Malus domestica]
MNSQSLPGHQNPRIPWGPNAGMDNIDIVQIQEPGENPTRVQKPPIEKLHGIHQPTEEVQPPLVDEGVEEVAGNWELRENAEEELVRDERGGIGCRWVKGKGIEGGGEVGLGVGRRRGGGGREGVQVVLELHLHDNMLESVVREAQWGRPLGQNWR